MKEKISVIVPVYNVEAYLNVCVDSILQQSYENFEVLLVDDGSKDASGAICDRYAALDERVKVIHQNNQGLSGARNTGIDHASGEYLCFIDSDDRIHPQFLEILHQAVGAEAADFSICAYQKYYDDEEISVHALDAEQTEWWDRIRMMTELCCNDGSERNVYATIMCNKLFRSDLFRELRFPMGKLHEDEYMISQLLTRMTYAAVCREKLYFYRQRRDSITGRAPANIRSLHDGVEAIVQRCELLEGEKDAPVYAQLINHSLGYIIYRYQSLTPDMEQYRQARSFLRQSYKKLFFRYRKYVKIKRFYIFLLSPGLMNLWAKVKDS